LNIKTKILFSIIPVTLIALVSTSLLSYISFKSALTSQILNHLESVASIQKSRIEAIISQHIERLVLISSRTQLRISLKNYNQDRGGGSQEKIITILKDARKSIPSFEEISVLNTQGVVVASTNAERIESDLSSELFFIDGLTKNKVDYLFLNGKHELKTYFSGPLELEGVLLGVIVVTSNVDHLRTAVGDYSGLGKSGETVLGKDGKPGEIIFLMPIRFDPEAALKSVSLEPNHYIPMIQALEGKEGLISDVNDERGVAVFAATKYIDALSWGLVVKIDRSEALAPTLTLKNELVGFILISLLSVTFIGFFIARQIAKPLSNITDEARFVTEKYLSEKTIKHEKNEVKSLESSFRQMTQGLLKANRQLKDTQAQLVQSAKLASLGELATGVAHELNQPLQIIKMSAEIGSLDLQAKDLNKADSYFQQINAQVDRAAEIIQHLKVFGRDAQLQKRESIAPNAIVKSSLIMLNSQLESEGITLVLALSEDLPTFLVNPVEIEQVIVNLIANARDALEVGREKKIIIRTAKKYHCIVFEVEDSGVGISPVVREKLFDPFFTTKPVGKGTGLGLSICYGIVQAYHGTIEVKSELGKGSIFTVKIPIPVQEKP